MSLFSSLKYCSLRFDPVQAHVVVVRPLHVLWAWIPVTYEDKDAVANDVVVVSLRMMQWAVPK